ncbi:glycosyltransferase family 4 protein [Candidatus Woesearchaeota archaeon]|nr:glycosyltransferase family 4 protein [Candidatus Woesearchaeota archaeon]
MIKIIFWYQGIADLVLNKKSHGGAEVQLLELSKKLAEDKKYKIIVLCNENFKKFNIEFVSENKIINKIKFKPISIIIKKIKLLKYIYIFKKIKPEIVITRTASQKVWYSAIISKILKFKSIFMCAHENDTNTIFQKEQKLGIKYKIGLKLSSIVITQTKEQRKLLLKYYHKNSTIIDSAQKIPKEFIKKKGEYILWVGRSIEWKRPEIFLDIAKTMPNQNFKMVCNPAKGKEKYHQELKIKSLKIKNLEFIEFIPHEKINKIFKKAAIFINTSTKEGFPNTFIEAGKNKTPIISLNVNPNNIFKTQNIGLYCNNNQNIIPQHIKTILKNWQKYATSIFIYTSKNHNIENTSKIYKNLIETRK